jgi:hypothetical protein
MSQVSTIHCRRCGDWLVWCPNDGNHQIAAVPETNGKGCFVCGATAYCVFRVTPEMRCVTWERPTE